MRDDAFATEHGIELVPLAAFESRPETEVLVALLKSSGIHAVAERRHDPLWNGPAHAGVILVPRNAVERAREIIAAARDPNSGSGPETTPQPEEPASIVTAFTWTIAIMILVYGLTEIVAGLAHRLILHK